MRFPLNLLLGGAILIAQSLLGMFFILMELSGTATHSPFGHFFLVSGHYGGPTIFMTFIGLVFAFMSLYYVLKGDELGRALFLIWTTFVLVIGLMVSQDPRLVLLDTTMRVFVLFLWFTPDASRYFFDRDTTRSAIS